MYLQRKFKKDLDVIFEKIFYMHIFLTKNCQPENLQVLNDSLAM